MRDMAKEAAVDEVGGGDGGVRGVAGVDAGRGGHHAGVPVRPDGISGISLRQFRHSRTPEYSGIFCTLLSKEFG